MENFYFENEVIYFKQSLYRPDGYHLNTGGLKVLAANWKTAIHPSVGLGIYDRRRRNNATPVQPRNGRVHRTSRDQPRDGRNSGTPNTRTVSPTSPSQTSRDNGRNTDDVQTPRSDEGYRATNRLPPDPRNRGPALFAQGPEAAWPTPREAADRRHPARRPHPPMGPAHEAVWPTPREAADMRHPVSRQHPPSGPAIPLRPFSPYVPDYEHFYSNWYPETWGVPRPWFSRSSRRGIKTGTHVTNLCWLKDTWPFASSTETFLLNYLDYIPIGKQSGICARQIQRV
ncbi:hypothetical protein Bbelb_366780 [Branchiostoma belcheri]|nr:hypothetical protein Bbelb_366780 [Branchiostoma belcheri]